MKYKKRMKETRMHKGIKTTYMKQINSQFERNNKIQ